MAKHNNKGRSKHGPAFVMMRNDLMDSAAWMSLNPASRAVYLQISRRYNGQNNGFLAASVDCLASECHAAPNTVTASLKRLIAVGLIERSREGSFACKVGMAAEYRLTCHSCDKTGHKATDAFKSWREDNIEVEPGSADAGLLNGPASRSPSPNHSAYG